MINKPFSSLLVLATFLASNLIAQDYIGVLQSDSYKENPVSYLQSILSTQNSTDILLDNVLYTKNVFDTPGTGAVKTTNYQEWGNIYRQVNQASKRSFTALDTLIMVSNANYKYEKVNALCVTNFLTKKINGDALINGDFKEEENYLNDIHSSKESYDQNRVFNFSCLTHNLYGNEIKFRLEEFFHKTNNKQEQLVSLKIDLDDGNGYQRFAFGDILTGRYNGESDFIELKLEANYYNSVNEKNMTLRAHSVVYRMSPKWAGEESSNHNKRSTTIGFNPLTPTTSYFPTENANPPIKIVTYKDLDGNYLPYLYREFTSETYSLEVNIVKNPKNNSSYLRRPFVVVDGFDPGNGRDYFHTRQTKDMEDYLPYERDFRGLYEIVNGNPSPWYDGHPAANLVSKLQNNGFDLVFINFMNGAGNIIDNANLVQRYINEVLNGTLRDNQTEELVIVGPSMGGIITRIAIKEIEIEESENLAKEHLVKSWVSFDSPHSAANIPIALQQAINCGAQPGALSSSFSEKRSKLNTPAARQLLNQHFTSTNYEGHSMHRELQNILTNMGYPTFSLNHAITNGGKSALYEGRNTILNYGNGLVNFDGWSQKYDQSSQTLLSGTVLFSSIGVTPCLVVKSGHRGIDGAPGGWLSSAYSFNFEKSNLRSNSISNVPTKWTTFIPTYSAFGAQHALNPATDLIKPWTAFTSINDTRSGKIITPFDKILGMETNEEHVRISEKTANVVSSEWLNADLTHTVRPVRRGKIINQKVSQPIAYNVRKTIEFAGENNTFTFLEGTHANVKAGEKISFKKGFRATKKTKLNAKIVLETNNYFKKSTTKISTEYSHNYLNDTPYVRKYTNYSTLKKNTTTQEQTKLLVHIYPNPTVNVLTIQKGHSGLNKIEIVNNLGQLVISTTSEKSTLQLNVSKLSPGLYHITLGDHHGQTIKKKFVKM